MSYLHNMISGSLDLFFCQISLLFHSYLSAQLGSGTVADCVLCSIGQPGILLLFGSTNPTTRNRYNSIRTFGNCTNSQDKK